MADQVPLLVVAAALCRTLAEVLDELDDPPPEEAARAAVHELADRLEAAVEATPES